MVKATMARFFNHFVQADCFVLFGTDFILMIDECFRYKQGNVLADHSFDEVHSSSSMGGYDGLAL